LAQVDFLGQFATLLLFATPPNSVALFRHSGRHSMAEVDTDMIGATLRLPALRRSPSPLPDRLALGWRDRLQEQESSDVGVCAIRSGRQYGRSRQPAPRRNRCGDDFDCVPRAPARARGQTGQARAMQRRAIDDETSLPEEIYQRVLRLGREAHARQTHICAFASSNGQPILRHYDAERLRAERQYASAAAELASVPSPTPMADLPQRAGSSCALESMWEHASMEPWNSMEGICVEAA